MRLQCVRPYDFSACRATAGRSPYAEFLEAHGEGLHHLAYVVDSIAVQLAALNSQASAMSVLLDVAVPNGVRFVYVQGAPHGPLLELIELPEGVALYPT